MPPVVFSIEWKGILSLSIAIRLLNTNPPAFNRSERVLCWGVKNLLNPKLFLGPIERCAEMFFVGPIPRRGGASRIEIRFVPIVIGVCRLESIKQRCVVIEKTPSAMMQHFFASHTIPIRSLEIIWLLSCETLCLGVELPV